MDTNTNACAQAKSYSDLIHQPSSWKQHTRSSHPCLCLGDFWGQPVVFFMPFFFPSCVWWMFDCPPNPPTMALGEYDQAQLTRPQRPWNIHIHELLSGPPDSLVRVNNAPAVTPSMRPNHINEVSRGPNPAWKSGFACMCMRVCILLYLCILCCQICDLYSCNGNSRLRFWSLSAFTNFSCYCSLSSWEASFMFTS